MQFVPTGALFWVFVGCACVGALSAVDALFPVVACCLAVVFALAISCKAASCSAEFTLYSCLARLAPMLLRFSSNRSFIAFSAHFAFGAPTLLLA